MAKDCGPGASCAIAIGLAGCLSAGAVLAQENLDAPALEEIIVTAQRRGDENLQNTAMSAAVISSELINRKQLVGMDDYLRTIPSVNFQEYFAGSSTITIRGASADPQLGTGTTGVYVDEVPLSGMGDFENSSPELKLVDVRRVEILRGPQGTLYGSGSVGGTVRIITEKPRLDEFGGFANVSSSYTAGLGSENYDAQGVINIPLKQDVFAIRAVAYYFDRSGNFKNVAANDPVKSASAAATGGLVRNHDDVGSSTYKGGRISALWAPSDELRLNLMYLHQKIEQEGQPMGDLSIGQFEQARYSRFSTGRGEYTKDDLSVLNLLIEYDLGKVALVSSTSWNEYEDTKDWDIGKFLDFLYGEDAPIFLHDVTSTKSFVQELRFTSKWEYPLNFLAGVYYENRRPTLTQLADWAGDPAADPFDGELLVSSTSPRKEEQLAFFGELYWNINEALAATAGIRHFRYQKSLVTRQDGLWVGGPVKEASSAEATDNTYKLNLSYKPDESALYYAQWSQGFRLGEPLIPQANHCDLDGDGLIDGIGLAELAQLDSDNLDAYEVGGKWSLVDKRVEVRSAAFYNKWTKLPISRTGDCGGVFLFNAGKAMTAGLELEGSAQLSRSWRLDFSAGYLKAELTSDAPGLGLDGDRLPGTPKYNATLGLQYDFMYRSHDGFFRGDVADVGGYYNNLQQEGLETGDYTTINLAAGLQLGRWDLLVFIQNLTNSSAATWLNIDVEYPSAYRLRPRTTGVSLRYAFGAAN